MRLVSCRRGGITGVDFTASWRLLVDAVPRADGSGAAFALVYRFQPGVPIVDIGGRPMAVGAFSQVVLAAANVDVAETPDALKPVATVALLGGDRDADVARTAEAINLFRNLSRVRNETMEAVLHDCTAIIEGYWQIRTWLAAGSQERLQTAIVDAQILGLP